MTASKIKSVLSKFGLNDNEVKTYLQILKSEFSSPYALSKKTGIPRTTMYDIIQSLSQKGIVEQFEENDSMKVRALNPGSLRREVQNRHQDLYDLELGIAEVMPQLVEGYKDDEPNADFQFIPGIEGAKKTYFGAMYEDINVPRYVITNLTSINAFGSEEEMERGMRNSNLTQTKEIIPLKDWSKHILGQRYQKNPGFIDEHEYRVLDNPVFDIYQRMTIIENRVLISCSVRSESWGMIVNSVAFSGSIKSIFDVLWLQSKPLTNDLIESWSSDSFLASQLMQKK